jgi:hypothetical protein
MSGVLAILALVACLAAIWNLVAAVFAYGRRKRKLTLAAISFAVAIGFAVAFSIRDDYEAREAGFIDGSDRRAAEEAGFIEKPGEWSAVREIVASEKERAKAERRQAEQRARKEEEEKRRRVEEAKRAEEKAAEEQKVAGCRSDLECWGEKAWNVATFSCPSLIERMAKYDFEWTDGILEPKFSHYRWRDKDRGIVTVIGDKIKMQNGFGAWMHMTYECDVNPQAEAALDVRVREGRRR